ncbi:MAG: fluoride efflux transporter FluC [Acidimicrobiales bacterium]
MTGLDWLGFSLAAAVGAPLRYLVDLRVGPKFGTGLPWGILVVNLSGSLLFGLIAGLAIYHGLPNAPVVILGTGFCGSFTTFSTFMWDTLKYAEGRDGGKAVGNVALTLIACAAAASAGLGIAAF